MRHTVLTDWTLRRRRRTRAAGISTLQLVCHPDTWDTILNMWPSTWPNPLTGSVTERPDGLISVALSGPNVVKLVELCQPGGYGQSTYTDTAIARRTYRGVASVIDNLVPSGPDGDAPPIPPVVIDDRPSTGI